MGMPVIRIIFPFDALFLFSFTFSPHLISFLARFLQIAQNCCLVEGEEKKCTCRGSG